MPQRVFLHLRFQLFESVLFISGLSSVLSPLCPSGSDSGSTPGLFHPLHFQGEGAGAGVCVVGLKDSSPTLRAQAALLQQPDAC